VIHGTRDKGPQHGNQSGWTVSDLLAAMDGVLERLKPEVAIVMIGTNDISGGNVPQNYEKDLEAVVKTCLDAKCIPILNTIPPRRDRDKAVVAVNAIIRDVARKHHVPLVDYHAAILALRPGDSWQGTILDTDGVHPTGGMTNVYTQDNMKNCGYALRNWVNFLAYRQVYFQVLDPPVP
jgi:lysophospholipase L1-like esterase